MIRKGETNAATVAAAIITRNRTDMLKKTLDSLKLSTYQFSEIIVSDDGDTNSTFLALQKEYPEITWVQGPKRGIAANRNNAVLATHSDYVLLVDDDILVDPAFVATSMLYVQDATSVLYFPLQGENGTTIRPNAISFLGYLTAKYSDGMPYHTANGQCFIMSRSIAENIKYDEIISIYGSEEIDFAYRVAAAGYRIQCIESCIATHLDPLPDDPSRYTKDASRLYVTFKRYCFIDKNIPKSIAFAAVAAPHHVLACIKRHGVKGIPIAFTNIRLAIKMLSEFRRKRL